MVDTFYGNPLCAGTMESWIYSLEVYMEMVNVNWVETLFS